MFCSRCGTQVDTSSRFCPTCGLDLSAQTGAGKAGATAPIAAQPAQEDETAIVREALKDEYELEKELGRGGMAVVFKARDKQLEREVAIKVLPFSLSFDAEFVERFQREARTAGKLEHPNIIPIYRVGRSGRVIYFVMKFIRGKSLSAVIEARGAIPIPELKRLLTECVKALGYAHKHGIVHRDIKPDNIMFDEQGQAIVTDFGIAKAQSGAKLTGTGMSIGTPHYMSPEQARAQNLDGRSDIYSLGVVAYQCLTGHVPFDGEDSFSIGYKHIMEELPVPALDHADQREMFSIVQKMMAKKPDDRFQNAEELVGALEGSVASGPDMSTMPTRAIEPMHAPPKAAPPVASAPTAPLPRASASMGKPKDAAAAGAAAPVPAAPAKPSFKPKEVTPKKSNKGLIAAIAILGVAGAGLGGYIMLSKKNVVVTPPPIDSTAIRAQQQLAMADSLHRDSLRVDSIRAESAKAATTKRPPDTTKKPPEGNNSPVGTIALHGNIPRNATIKVDGKTERGSSFRVQPGPHTVEIAAQGFATLTSPITVEAGKTASINVALAPAPTGATTTTTTTTAATGGRQPPECLSPQVGKENHNHQCYDERPTPQTQTTIDRPPSCPRASSVQLVVNVSATGEVTGTPIVYRSSGCTAFDDVAKGQILDIQFRAAKLHGTAVASWVVVPMQAR